MKSVWMYFVVVLFGNFYGCFNTGIDKEETKLLAVIVIYRHGDRAPFTSFPKDKYYNLTYWPMGFGHLTTQGIQRHYKLGQWFRERYKSFLSEIYSPKEIYVQSTNIDRCLMSAAANLAGLYPPKHHQIWNDIINWQPIPVHTGYETVVMEEPCPVYEKLYKKVTQIVFQMFENKYQKIFRFIAEQTGWKNFTMHDVSTLRSVLYVYQNYNTSFIPEWTRKLDPRIIDYIAGVKYAIPTGTATLTRLRIGTFYDYMFKYFDTFIDSSLPKKYPKFMMISTHDTTITSILHGMGLYKMRPVGFGDTFIIELRKRNNGTYFVNLSYKIEHKLEKLIFQGCQYDCDYNKLKARLYNLTLDVYTRRRECVGKKF